MNGFRPKNCHFEFTINVFTYNRLDGLKRLWKSLVETEYMGTKVDMVLFQDFDHAQEANSSRSELNRWIATEAVWPHGRFQVFKKLKRQGLVESIIGAWWPMSENALAAFFEDDLEVSPFWFRWVLRALDTYYFVPDRNPRLFGLALYRPVYDELTFRPIPPRGRYRYPFVMQQPCSWGQVFFPGPWRYFRHWRGNMLRRGKEPRLSNANPAIWVSSDFWPSQSSWKKYLIYLMYEKGLFMIYPDLPQRHVLSTNHFMKGEHSTPDYNLHHLPLLTPEVVQRWSDLGMRYNIYQMPPLDHLKVLDFRATFKRNLTSLHGSNETFFTPAFAPAPPLRCDQDAHPRDVQPN